MRLTSFFQPAPPEPRPRRASSEPYPATYHHAPPPPLQHFPVAPPPTSPGWPPPPAPLTRTAPPPPHPWWSYHHRDLSRCRIRSASSVVVPVGSGGVRLQRRHPRGIRWDPPPPPPHSLPPCGAGQHRRAARPRPHCTNERISLNLRRWIQAPPVRPCPKYLHRCRRVPGSPPLGPPLPPPILRRWSSTAVGVQCAATPRAV
uniref:Uncharacterized protein n=1 Tax=Triticum urartu TaxID=4572 RepID=A0A8R7TP83_TRIUA